MAKLEHLCRPTIESPTWGHLIDMATTIIEVMGGPKGAASKLSWENFYTLTVLASLNLNDARRAEFILGRQYID